MAITGIIPARYGSKRFPGKPLAKILGKTMIQRVWENACRARRLDNVVIAADDKRIVKEAGKFKAKAILTGKASSGSERAAAAAKKLKSRVIINIQGDEPLMEPAVIDAVAKAFNDKSVKVATAACAISQKEFLSPDTVKVIVDREGNAIYFSRSPIPHGAGKLAMKHIGIYGYTRKMLVSFPKLKSALAGAEDLEQLKFIENGIKIKVVTVKYGGFGVDRPSDISRVERVLRRESRKK